MIVSFNDKEIHLQVMQQLCNFKTLIFERGGNWWGGVRFPSYSRQGENAEHGPDADAIVRVREL
jgi:hypothetical protein